MTTQFLPLSQSQKMIPLLSILIFFSVLNATMFNVAIPEIARSFRLTPALVSWVITGFSIFFAIGSLLYGRLGDFLPIRRLIFYGLILFNIGSLIGFFAESYLFLVGARIIQALGGAAIPALAMIIATRYFSSEHRGKVLGMVAATVAFGSAVGPLIGGYITHTFHWHFLFLLSSASLLLLPFLQHYLPEEMSKKGSFDYLGAFLISTLTIGLILFISLSYYWALILSLISLLLYHLHLKKSKTPFISLALLKNNRYRNTLLVAFICFGLFMATIFLSAIALDDLYQLNPLQISYIFLPGTILAIFSGRWGGKTSDRRGSHFVVISGIICLTFSFLLALFLISVHQYIVMITISFLYIGFAMVQSGLAITISQTISSHETGIAMGLYNMVSFIAGAFSTALVGKWLEIFTHYSTTTLFKDFNALSYQYHHLFLIYACFALVALMIYYRTHIHSFIRKQ